MAPFAFRSDPCWDAYPHTVLEFADPPVLRIDLREPVGPEQCRALTRLGLPGTFAVVTACNPRGRRLSGPENQRRSRWLRAQVAAAAIESLRADGVSTDGRHREPGLALAVDDPARAIRIAVACEQSAIFWFDGRRFSILPVLETGVAGVNLPLTGAAGSGA